MPTVEHRSLTLSIALIAGLLALLAGAPGSRAQSEETPPTTQEFGPWMLNCTTNTVYQYTFCNTFYNKELSGAADNVVRFGVTRTLGVERVGLVAVKGISPGSKIVIGIDKAQHWTFEAGADVGLLVPPAESRKIIDQLLKGKSVRVTFTPAGGTQQAIEVSLATFPEALRRARELAK